jgi:dnd system-associated protein 4
MARVYIDTKFSDMSTNFVKKHTKIAGRSIFSTNMEMMIFASMVGYSVEEDWEKKSVDQRGNEIDDSIFVDNRKDGIPYLLALQAIQSGDILRDLPVENETQVWKIFENYAHIGFLEIEKWRLDNPSDTDGVDTLLNMIKEKAELLFDKPSPEPGEITF